MGCNVLHGEEMMSDQRTVVRMLEACRRYGLSGEEFCRQFPLAVLAEDYNGIGPEWFPEILRNAVNSLCADLCAAAFVHDIRFSHSDGSVEQFVAANDEFRANGYRIANGKYSWYDPRRYIVRHRTRVFYRLLVAFGWTAYIAAYIKSRNQTASVG